MKKLIILALSLIALFSSSYGQFYDFSELALLYQYLDKDPFNKDSQTVVLKNRVNERIRPFLKTLGITFDYSERSGYFLSFYNSNNKIVASLEPEWIPEKKGYTSSIKAVRNVRLYCFPKGYSTIEEPSLFIPKYYPVNYSLYVYCDNKWCLSVSDYFDQAKKIRLIKEYYIPSEKIMRTIELNEIGTCLIKEFNAKGKLLIEDKKSCFGYKSSSTGKIIQAAAIFHLNDRDYLQVERKQNQKDSIIKQHLIEEYEEELAEE